MSEFLQAIIRQIWELLVTLPMPWRAIFVLLVLMSMLSWLFWRAFPLLIAKLAQLVFISVEVLTNLLLFTEYLLTKHIRKQRHKPLEVIYIFDDLLGGIVRLVYKVSQLLERLLVYALSKRWLPRKQWFIIPVIIVPLIWYVRPILGESTVGKLETWWYSFEGWVISGRWTPSALSFPPEQFVRDYFSNLNNGQYKTAWNSLSPEFQNNKKLNKCGYICYLGWWKTVDRVEINNINVVVSKNNASALVDIQSRLIMKNGKVFPKPWHLGLRWDAKTDRWLVHSSK